MSKKIVLISCVKRKLTHPAKAKDMYISNLFKKLFAYAQLLNPDLMFILSAKYGLLKLDEVIEPYELTLNNMRIKDRKEWSNNVLKKLKKHTDLENDNFVFLAGERYREFILPYIKHYEIPLQGLGFGPQLSWLKKRLP